TEHFVRNRGKRSSSYERIARGTDLVRHEQCRCSSRCKRHKAGVHKQTEGGEFASCVSDDGLGRRKKAELCSHQDGRREEALFSVGRNGQHGGNIEPPETKRSCANNRCYQV